MWQGLGLQKRGVRWWARGLLHRWPASEALIHRQELRASILMPQVLAAVLPGHAPERAALVCAGHLLRMTSRQCGLGRCPLHPVMLAPVRAQAWETLLQPRVSCLSAKLALSQAHHFFSPSYLLGAWESGRWKSVRCLCNLIKWPFTLLTARLLHSCTHRALAGLRG